MPEDLFKKGLWRHLHRRVLILLHAFHLAMIHSRHVLHVNGLLLLRRFPIRRSGIRLDVLHCVTAVILSRGNQRREKQTPRERYKKKTQAKKTPPPLGPGK